MDKGYKSDKINLIYDLNICRLCGEISVNGYQLYNAEINDSEEDLRVVINKYLPLKIADDGVFPRWICGGCHLQVEATRRFFNLIEDGQVKLQKLYELECKKLSEINSSLESTNNKDDNASVDLSDEDDDLNSISDENHSSESQEESEININHLKAKMLQQQTKFEPLRCKSNQNVNLQWKSKLGTISLIKRRCEENKKITFYSDQSEPCSQPLPTYAQEVSHLSVKKKPGRPRKHQQLQDNSPLTSSSTSVLSLDRDYNDKQDSPKDNSEDETTAFYRTRSRNVKPPLRYQNSVHGQEYERVYHDMGIISKDGRISNAFDDDDLIVMNDSNDRNDDIIGFVQTKDGESLGDLVVIKNNDNNFKRTVNKTNMRTTTYLICDICKLSFLKENMFLQHRLTHKNIRFECSECLTTFKNKNLLIEHQLNESHYGSGVIEECTDSMDVGTKISENETENRNNLSLIKFTQSPDKLGGNENQETTNPPVENNLKYSCKICKDKIYKSCSSLSYHVMTEHNDGRVFVCSRCNKQFSSKECLKSHQSTHVTVKPYKCQICAKGFKTKSLLKSHKSIHTGDKKFPCDKCDQKFSRKRSLFIHGFIHAKLKPFKCDFCGKSFTQSGNLQEHRRIHTGERPYCCHICNKRFTASSQCKIHIERHNKTPPLKCTKCSKCFRKKIDLKIHLRRHMNIKPFKCDKCSKQFVESQALKKHQRVHTGERPYICTICQKAFGDRSNLIKHLKIHRNKSKNDLMVQIHQEVEEFRNREMKQQEVNQQEKLIDDSPEEITMLSTNQSITTEKYLGECESGPSSSITNDSKQQTVCKIITKRNPTDISPTGFLLNSEIILDELLRIMP